MELGRLSMGLPPVSAVVDAAHSGYQLLLPCRDLCCDSEVLEIVLESPSLASDALLSGSHRQRTLLLSGDHLDQSVPELLILNAGQLATVSRTHSWRYSCAQACRAADSVLN